jgi:hypothetical protein
VHQFNAGDRDRRVAELLEPQHDRNALLDAAMVLFNQVIEVLRWSAWKSCSLHFDSEIILLCVRWYLRFKLSLRDLVEMMAERGMALAHTTIMRWVQHYTPEFEKRCQSHALAVGRSWRVATMPLSARISSAARRLRLNT